MLNLCSAILRNVTIACFSIMSVQSITYFERCMSFLRGCYMKHLQWNHAHHRLRNELPFLPRQAWRFGKNQPATKISRQIKTSFKSVLQMGLLSLHLWKWYQVLDIWTSIWVLCTPNAVQNMLFQCVFCAKSWKKDEKAKIAAKCLYNTCNCTM